MHDGKALAISYSILFIALCLVSCPPSPPPAAASAVSAAAAASSAACSAVSSAAVSAASSSSSSSSFSTFCLLPPSSSSLSSFSFSFSFSSSFSFFFFLLLIVPTSPSFVALLILLFRRRTSHGSTWHRWSFWREARQAPGLQQQSQVQKAGNSAKGQSSASQATTSVSGPRASVDNQFIKAKRRPCRACRHCHRLRTPRTPHVP